MNLRVTRTRFQSPPDTQGARGESQCDAPVGALGIQHVETTDGDLVRRVLAGDAPAYAGLVARHRDRLIRYARQVLGNREDAEEAVQDAFVRAYRSLERCEGPENYGRWLFGILVNRCRTRYGQAARRAAVVVHDDVAMAEAEAPGDPDGVAWRDTVYWALDRLSPEFREAFLLKYVEELSYDEMAELTGTGVSALKMRVSRACERLRVMLEEVERV